MVVAGVVADSLERNVLIAGAVTQFALFGVAALSRWWMQCAFGRGKHLEWRKPFFAYWKLFTFFTFVADMFMLFKLWDTARDASHPSVNWSRWAFYIVAYGGGLVGMIAEFHVHALHWTRYYIGVLVGAVSALMLANAFAPEKAQRDMLFGFIAFFGAWAIYALFHFDERPNCVRSRLTTVLAVLCLATVGAIFIVGHANQNKLARAHEFIAYVVVNAVLGGIVPFIIVWIGASHLHYIAPQEECTTAMMVQMEQARAVAPTMVATGSGIVGM